MCKPPERCKIEHQAELDEDLGYSKYDYKNKATDNSRNGHSSKNLRTSFGDVEVSVSRDRKGEFEPQLLKKNQTSISQDIYGLAVSDTTVSRITDKILPVAKEWQHRDRWAGSGRSSASRPAWRSRRAACAHGSQQHSRCRSGVGAERAADTDDGEYEPVPDHRDQPLQHHRAVTASRGGPWEDRPAREKTARCFQRKSTGAVALASILVQQPLFCVAGGI